MKISDRLISILLILAVLACIAALVIHNKDRNTIESAVTDSYKQIYITIEKNRSEELAIIDNNFNKCVEIKQDLNKCVNISSLIKDKINLYHDEYTKQVDTYFEKDLARFYAGTIFTAPIGYLRMMRTIYKTKALKDIK